MSIHLSFALTNINKKRLNCHKWRRHLSKFFKKIQRFQCHCQDWLTCVSLSSCDPWFKLKRSLTDRLTSCSSCGNCSFVSRSSSIWTHCHFPPWNSTKWWQPPAIFGNWIIRIMWIGFVRFSNLSKNERRVWSRR